MATANDIITAAYRESNLIALAATVSTAQQTEALNRLNSLILSSLGNEAGEELSDINIGGSYDQSSYCSQWVPANARLVLNLSSAKTLKLHPEPYEGQRLAVADVTGNLATFNLTLDPNGRRIENATTLALSANQLSRQWLYRGDIGDWKKITSLISSDEMPFPTEFDDYFVLMLAMRLNPRQGQAIARESAATLDRWSTALQARYRRPRPMQDMGSLGLLGQEHRAYSDTIAFNLGRP